MTKQNFQFPMGILVSLLGVGFILFMAWTIVPKVLVTLTKAAPSSKVSLTNTLLIGERISAEANGKDEVKVNVFVLDNNGRGIGGKRVALTGMEGIRLAGESMTDSSGKVGFVMSSTKEGQYTLEASIEGVALAKKLVVTFKEL